jgi:hypothetical protein
VLNVTRRRSPLSCSSCRIAVVTTLIS